jgi:vacuolar-type H+-ATPase subunit I/STV1
MVMFVEVLQLWNAITFHFGDDTMTNKEIQAETLVLVRRVTRPIERAFALRQEVEKLQAELAEYEESTYTVLEELREHLNATSASSIHDELVRERGVRARLEQDCEDLRQQLSTYEGLVLRLQQSSDEAYHIVGDFLDALENKK